MANSQRVKGSGPSRVFCVRLKAAESDMLNTISEGRDAQDTVRDLIRTEYAAKQTGRSLIKRGSA